MIYRLFVEKKSGFDVQAKNLKSDLVNVLKLNAEDVRMFLRYDVEGLSETELASAVTNVFSEPPCDEVTKETLPALCGYDVFGVEYLTGQYDQRADSAEQCVQLLIGKRPTVRCAKIYAVKGLSANELDKMKGYLVNPTDSRLAAMEKPDSLQFEAERNDRIDTVDGFITDSDKALKAYHKANGFAMSLEDLLFVRDYFKGLDRNPTVTELKVIDTYWSDHCRHTTFLTELKTVEIDGNEDLKQAFEHYKSLFQQLYKGRDDKYVSLMDLATIGAKALRKAGKLDDLDVSDEINACSIKIKAEVNGESEDWLLMFKNETHNHPTEIEPFGGAATCLGGAIRDPLSGRVYVYQAMRITGAGDVFRDVSETLQGKLPQRVISKTATAGFSSYGNQIGLATGIVNEVYHDDYVAKRLETGFVIGAAPAENVVREVPEAGDVVILLGGETGRDGCGGATGSSKAHSVDSVTECGAEVQKGNPLTERKIQRLFRNPEVTRLIRRSNDFGAGGVSVAIGELADGLDIYLDRVPKKYQGLNVTEIAISESQERMAVVVRKKDSEKFMKLTAEENLQATVVAEVTDSGRMRMFLNGKTVVDLERSFLNTNGVKQTASVKVRRFEEKNLFRILSEESELALSKKDYKAALLSTLKEKNVMIQKGLTETFDASIGAGTVVMPFGGKTQLTPSVNMIAKLPVLHGDTATGSVCSWGFNAELMNKNPFVGAVYSVVSSVSKIVAGGADIHRVRLTLQEFFKKLNGDSVRFGEPFAALLGALTAQLGLGTAAIGGKDSMSGTFENIDVPNTLISFAVAPVDVRKVVSNVFSANRKLWILPVPKKGNLPDFEKLVALYETVFAEIQKGNVTAATVLDVGGAVAAAVKSLVGNDLGAEFAYMDEALFESNFGDFIVEAEDGEAFVSAGGKFLAKTNESGKLTGGIDLRCEDAKAALMGFDSLYPSAANAEGQVKNVLFTERNTVKPRVSAVKPKVFIPVFPGTNCEYDTARRFLDAGAETDVFVVKNRTSAEIAESVEEMRKRIRSSQIIAFPGGFSGGDEPDGSGKFIATTFRNPLLSDAVAELMEQRDGLILGICNGFQALIKLGLVPYGKIVPMKNDAPTLTFNRINRHVSTVVNVRVASVKSPWLAGVEAGETYAVPVSHGEGRFVSTEEELNRLIANGQIATQYADLEGNATMASPFNPNGSLYAVEGITSPDGRVFGKMGHAERTGENLLKNIPFETDMKIFLSGVAYFK